MARIRVKVNPRAVDEIMKSAPVRAMLERRARAIARAAGDGMEVDSQVFPRRARASVRTTTTAARRAEAKDRVLTRALDAGRGPGL